MVRRKAFWAVVSIPLIIAGICGWLTEPLEAPSNSSPAAVAVPEEAAETRPALGEWPVTPINGRAATQLLLDSLLDAESRLEAARAYSALLRKTERLKGKLGSEQVIEIKSRLHPFSIYLRYRTPEPGKEVVYSEGRYENHVIAHGVGISRTLIPRLKVAPDSMVAMSGNRHPITDAGLGKLTAKLIGFRRMDLVDPESVTVLDRIKDDSGREWLRSFHTHPNPNSERPFKNVEVLYHPETRIPYKISSYDWLKPGETGEPQLAERYTYDDLKLGIPLTDTDFDPANPAYEFSRF